MSEKVFHLRSDGLYCNDERISNLNEIGEDKYEDDPDEWFLDWICGMGPDGQCSLAGSEECDFDCPRMR
jgi:hypothetical protein